MSTKLSLLSRAAAAAFVVAFALPALAQSNPPAATTAPSVSKQTAGEVEQKGEKKTHAKKDDKDHKQVAGKTMEPAGKAKTDASTVKQ